MSKTHSSDRQIWLAVITFTLSVLAACSSSPLDREMAIGKYVGTKNGAVERLDLRADGTYLQTYKPPEGQEVLRTDTWEFEIVKGEPNIVLEHFRPFL